MTDRIAQAIAATAADLDWFQNPHTLDQLIGVYAESLTEARPLSRRNLSNEECLRAISARGGGRGSELPDPTGNTAVQWVLAGEPDAIDDADGTMGAIDACLELMHEAAQELADLVADTTSTPRWLPRPAGTSRHHRLAVTSELLAALRPNLTTAVATMDADQLAQAEELARIHLAESAAWLRTKGEDIWRASRGDHRPVAVQRAIEECRHCSPWRKGTIAKVRGLCDQCAKFQSHYQCLPIEGIVRRWEYGRGATPTQVHESKAASRARRKAAG